LITKPTPRPTRTSIAIDIFYLASRLSYPGVLNIVSEISGTRKTAKTEVEIAVINMNGRQINILRVASNLKTCVKPDGLSAVAAV